MLNIAIQRLDDQNKQENETTPQHITYTSKKTTHHSMQMNASYLVHNRSQTAPFACIGQMQICALSLAHSVFIQRCIIRGPFQHFLPSSSHLWTDRGATALPALHELIYISRSLLANTSCYLLEHRLLFITALREHVQQHKGRLLLTGAPDHHLRAMAPGPLSATDGGARRIKII